MADKLVIDPWLLDASGNPDPFAGTIDFGMTAADERDPDLALDDHQGIVPDVIASQPVVPEEPPVDETPPPPPEREGPRTWEVEDGTATLEKEKGQWKLTLTNEIGGNPQVYWGKTREELFILGLGKAQLHSTKKIRELNKKVRLTALSAPKQVPQSPTPSVRQLTADEIFEIKSLWESDPSAALDLLIKKRTNVTLEELVGEAQKGAQANMSLETEAISRDFLQRNPNYYPDSENKNFQSLIKWLAKFKIGKNATDTNSGEIFSELWSTGNYTVENLEEAFQDLTDDGLLVKPRLPKPSPPVEVLPEPVPAPATSNPRILSTETRPRAATGIRTTDVTPVAPPAQPAAPTDEDLNNLSDDAVKSLLGQIRKSRIQARRS